MRHLPTALALAAALAATGCLEKDATSTIYLHPDGSLDWVVIEQNVRSNESDAGKRHAEELRYLDDAVNERLPVTEAFRAVGGLDVRTRVLRDRRPYATMTDARFESLSRLFDTQLAGCGVPYGITQTVEGDVTTWRLWADIGVDAERIVDGPGCGAALAGLFEDADLRIILLDATFTQVEGFTRVSPDTAEMADDDVLRKALVQHDGRLILSLSWTPAR